MKYKLFIALSLCLIINSTAQEIRVGSFNLRYDNPADSLNNWNYRKETVTKMITFHDFDILGTQEGLEHMLLFLDDNLPQYERIGVGRNDGKTSGEYAAIFYKKDKYELLDKGNFWLSETPDKPLKGWDAVLPRICSWGKFKEKSSSKIFYFFNTHFDHVGVKARSESAHLILDKIQSIASGIPVILTGDFNVDQHSASFKVFEESSLVDDAYDLAPLVYGANGTYNGFNTDVNSDERIDHIFITSNIQAIKHGILTDIYHLQEDKVKNVIQHGDFPKEITLEVQEGRLPSDHYPLLAVLKLN